MYGGLTENHIYHTHTNCWRALLFDIFLTLLVTFPIFSWTCAFLRAMVFFFSIVFSSSSPVLLCLTILPSRKTWRFQVHSSGSIEENRYNIISTQRYTQSTSNVFKEQISTEFWVERDPETPKQGRCLPYTKRPNNPPKINLYYWSRSKWLPDGRCIHFSTNCKRGYFITSGSRACAMFVRASFFCLLFPPSSLRHMNVYESDYHLLGDYNRAHLPRKKPKQQ